MSDIAHTFSPVEFLEYDAEFQQTQQNDSRKRPILLLILNQPIEDVLVGTEKKNAFWQAWNYCDFRVCADGGANRLYDYLSTDEQRTLHVPDLVAGDFDSIRPGVREFYNSQRTVVQHSSDQDSTDFMKCVQFAKQHLAPEFDLIVFGGLGGRVDQSFHSLHHLFLSAFPARPAAEGAESTGPLGAGSDDSRDTTQVDMQVYLVSPESVTFLIPEGGAARVRTPLAYLGPACGLIPLAGPTKITTHGLEWDVSDWPTSFGSRVSTSNHILHDFTEVETVGNPILFTVELRK